MHILNDNHAFTHCWVGGGKALVMGKTRVLALVVALENNKKLPSEESDTTKEGKKGKRKKKKKRKW